MAAPLRLASPTHLRLASPALTSTTVVDSPAPSTATIVASPIQANPEPDIIEAISDAERWLSVRRDFPDIDSSVPEIDHIIHETLKPLETYEIAGHYDTQMWIIERLVALRKCAQGFGIEVTEISTAIHLRLKAIMEMKTIVKQIKTSRSRSSHHIPVNAIKIHGKVLRSDIDGEDYHLRLSPCTSGYDLWKKNKDRATTTRMEFAIPLHELKTVYAPWPNALVFGVTFKDGSDITLEVPNKEDAEGLIGELKGMIMLEKYCGGQKAIESH